MDELDLLARALPDAPAPSPEVVARARARLAGAPATSGVRRRRAWGWTLGAALATATVVMMVVTLVSNLAAAPAPVLVRPPKGNQALLDLADRVERRPQESGAYWREVWIDGDRVPAGEYTLRVTSTRTVWYPRDTADPVLLEKRGPSARPATAADERAWRAAGSPGKVKPDCPKGNPADVCRPLPITDDPQGCTYGWRVDPKGQLGNTSVANLTLADLDALPADQAGLRTKLRTYHQIWYDQGFKQSFEEFLPTTANLLTMPLRPRVRAALLRLLAGLPTTKVYGEGTDPTGRKGLSVSFYKAGETYYLGRVSRPMPAYHRQFLDQDTGMMQAHATYAGQARQGLRKDDVFGYRASGVAAGWTDERPARPRNCAAAK